MSITIDNHTLDPVTQQILENAFVAICDEMGNVTIQTGNSTILVDGRDFSCAVLDADCRLVAAANFDPSHLSAMAFTTEYAYMEFGRDRLLPGDVMIVNDPYRAGGHLPDMCVIRPVFDGDRLIATTIVRAHHIDVGGMAISGFAGNAVSVYQEGVRIPPVHWFRAGVEQTDVMDLILLNVRFPQDQLGDFRAQLAATMRGEDRLVDLCTKYGTEAVLLAMRATQDHSEALMRAVLADIPDGEYRFDDIIDDDGASSQPYLLKVRVVVDGSDVLVDYTGTSAQATGPINSSYTNTLSATMNALLQIIGPDIHFNHGCFRPISIVAPRGSLVNPLNPAPVIGGVTETSIRIIDAVSGALAQTIPDRVAGAGYGTCQNVTGGGYDRALGKNVGFYLFLEGGWGATSWRDGWNSTPNPSSNFQDYPVELVEQTLPLECVSAGLYEGSGGPGRFRGGLGTERVFRVTSEGITLSAMADRHRHAPWGVFGGLPGTPSSIEVRLPGDSEFATIAQRFGAASPSKFANVAIPVGSLLRLRQGGGGGYGSPLERDPQRVLEDLVDELIDEPTARAVYGVVTTAGGSGPVLDEAATAAARRELATAEKPRLHFGVAATDGEFAAAVAESVGPELDVPTRATVERIGEFLARVDRAVASGSDAAVLSDPAASPIAHPTARSFWDERALKRWVGRHSKVIGRR